MKNLGLLQNRRFAIISFALTGSIVLYLFANFTVFFGDEFFSTSNSVLSVVVAFAASALCFIASANKKDVLSHYVWLGMAWGIFLWGVADLIWLVTPYMGIELPIPSIADVIWIAGYVPLFYAFIARLRSISISPSPSQMRMLAVVTTIMLIVTGVFVFRPIIADFDPERVWEGITNISYPIGDLGLAILASHMLILLKDGRFSLSWRFILGGFIMMTVSDLLYMYASWYDLYYFNDAANFITIIIESTYVTAYGMVGFGVFIYLYVWRIKEKHTMRAEITAANRFYTFVGTNSQNEIITVSDNFHFLVNANDISSFYHMKLDEALGITPDAIQAIIQRLYTQNVLGAESVKVTTYDKKPREVWLTAMGIFDLDKQYTGANFALSADIDTPIEARRPANPELLGMMNYLITLAGSRSTDEIRLIRAYILDIIQMLSSMVEQFGGEQFKKALFENLEQTVSEANLPLKVDHQVIVFSEESDVAVLSSSVNLLVKAALSFVCTLVGDEIVCDELEEYFGSQPESVLKVLDKFKLRDTFLTIRSGLTPSVAVG